MMEIEEQDNLNPTDENISIGYRDCIKLFEDFKQSKYSTDFINELDEINQTLIEYYTQLVSDSFNIKLEDRNIDLICKIAIAFLKSFEADEANIFYTNKEYNVSIFLSSNILLNSICRYVIRCKYNETIDHIYSSGKQEINYDNGVKFDIERIVNISYLLKILFPYLYDDNEIETFISQFKSINNTKEKVNFLVNFASASASRIKNEYQYTREFNEEVEKCIKEFYYSKLITPLGQRYLKLGRGSLETSRFIVLEFIEEYNKWKIDKFSYPAAFPNITYFFWQYYLFIDNQLMYYFFETFNEPHAFGKVQIDYIWEMAPKLRIASYLNEEYAKYKKLYNPNARVFNFGEDDPEEETFETVTSKDHLESLPHFEEDKLKELLKILIEAKYIEENTRDKDWLFAFGMSGDNKPKDFKKIQWTGGSNKGISPTYFTDFIGILGYDLNKIYFDKDQMSILNSCFMTTKEPIGQKSFCREKGEFKSTVKHKKMAKLVKECGLLTE